MSTAYHPRILEVQSSDGRNHLNSQGHSYVLLRWSDFGKGPWVKHLPLADVFVNICYLASIKASPYEGTVYVENVDHQVFENLATRAHSTSSGFDKRATLIGNESRLELAPSLAHARSTLLAFQCTCLKVSPWKGRRYDSECMARWNPRYAHTVTMYGPDVEHKCWLYVESSGRSNLRMSLKFMKKQGAAIQNMTFLNPADPELSYENAEDVTLDKKLIQSSPFYFSDDGHSEDKVRNPSKVEFVSKDHEKREVCSKAMEGPRLHQRRLTV
ncbi:hypothetical protein Tco_0058693 [Tanacetum coccineum]